MSTELNLLPPLLATLLKEQGTPAENIGIYPAEGHPGASMREVLELRTDRKTGKCSILVQHKSAERLALEREIDIRHPLQSLPEVFEEAFTRFQMETVRRERQHTLGLSTLQAIFFPETHAWNEDQQKILAFFRPYSAQMKGDLLLMGKCLTEALELPVRVQKQAAKTIRIGGAMTDTCMLNGGALVGGVLKSEAPNVLISIGPVPPDQLLQYVSGARQRRFLEAGLLPLMIPKTWDWETRIMVAPEHSIFRIPDTEHPLCADINAFIV